MSKLFSPTTVGNLKLKHRITLAPLTRQRSDDNHVPMSLAAEYYGQRASVPGTLLITEGTFISSEAGGRENVPGIWNEAQVEGWKKVTEAVHANGSYIFCQLWALGRTADPKLLEKDGHSVHGPSNLPMDKDSPIPTAMTEDDIQRYIQSYVKAAENSVKAGFDGVEIHGANGYLPDQFLEPMSNDRTDQWGGTIENRARFGTEIAKAVVAAIGPEKVGYRISPWSPFQGMKMDDPIPQFSHLIQNLANLNLAYLHIVESRISGSKTIEARAEQADFAMDLWGHGAVILAGGFTAESAEESLQRYNENNVLIAFGRHFLANPDLPFRLQQGLSLNKYDRSTFYIPKHPQGYVDYPFSQEFLKSKGQVA